MPHGRPLDRQPRPRPARCSRGPRPCRDDDGHYWTGIVFPDEVHFPGDERTTYTDAAVILAADALSRTSPAAGLFTDHDALPALVELDDEPVSDPTD